VYGALPPDSYAAVVSADGQIMQTQFFGRGNPPDHLDSIGRRGADRDLER
jgi:hypothetical protein